ALATLHLPPSWYPAKIFALARPDTFLHCVSQAEERQCPASAGLLPAIENGVPVDRLQTHCMKESYALALGRICPEKGFHLALAAAKRAGVPMVLAGPLFGYETHEDYFRREIAPALDQNRRFIGPADFERKRRLLAAARCLLAPSLAPETSSLAAMGAADTLDPDACRDAARRRFSAERMTGQYLQRYAQIARRSPQRDSGAAAWT